MQFDRKSNRTWLITVGALYALLLACGGATPPIAGTPSDAAAAAPSIRLHLMSSPRSRNGGISIWITDKR
jgi:hypothetical protein